MHMSLSEQYTNKRFTVMEVQGERKWKTGLFGGDCSGGKIWMEKIRGIVVFNIVHCVKN